MALFGKEMLGAHSYKPLATATESSAVARGRVFYRHHKNNLIA